MSTNLHALCYWHYTTNISTRMFFIFYHHKPSHKSPCLYQLQGLYVFHMDVAENAVVVELVCPTRANCGNYTCSICREIDLWTSNMWQKLRQHIYILNSCNLKKNYWQFAYIWMYIVQQSSVIYVTIMLIGCESNTKHKSILIISFMGAWRCPSFKNNKLGGCGNWYRENMGPEIWKDTQVLLKMWFTLP